MGILLFKYKELAWRCIYFTMDFYKNAFFVTLEQSVRPRSRRSALMDCGCFEKNFCVKPIFNAQRSLSVESRKVSDHIIGMLMQTNALMVLGALLCCCEARKSDSGPSLPQNWGKSKRKRSPSRKQSHTPFKSHHNTTQHRHVPGRDRTSGCSDTQHQRSQVLLQSARRRLESVLELDRS